MMSRTAFQAIQRKIAIVPVLFRQAIQLMSEPVEFADIDARDEPFDRLHQFIIREPLRSAVM